MGARRQTGFRSELLGLPGTALLGAVLLVPTFAGADSAATPRGIAVRNSTTVPVAGTYVPLSPVRITDTLSGSEYPNAGRTLTAGGSLNVQVSGAGTVPTNGVSAVVLNVTVV